MNKLRGTGVALVTPFTVNGAIDTHALGELVEYNISSGVDYLVVLGTTAESVTLSASEKQLVIDTVLLANEGRLPLVLGFGGVLYSGLCVGGYRNPTITVGTLNKVFSLYFIIDEYDPPGLLAYLGLLGVPTEGSLLIAISYPMPRIVLSKLPEQ